MNFEALAARVRASAPRCGPVRLIGVDGPGGSGKSTFARALVAALDDAPLVQIDDFGDWSMSADLWLRVEDQLLLPLTEGRPARYQRFDWPGGRLAEWHDVPLAPVIVFEGVSTARKAVRDRLSLAVWVHAEPGVRLARGLARDGESARDQWLAWMAAEDAHFAENDTVASADLVVPGVS